MGCILRVSLSLDMRRFAQTKSEGCRNGAWTPRVSHRYLCLLALLPVVILWALGFSLPLAVRAADSDDSSQQLFEGHSLRRLRISITETNLARLWRSPRAYVPATITEGSNTYFNVGVHLKGGERSGQTLNRRPSLSLRFDREDKNQTFYGLRRVKLNNCTQDPSGLNQVVSSWVFNAAGVPCPRAIPAMVELNGRNLGLYELEEGVDMVFLKRNYGVKQAAIYQGAYGVDIDGPAEKTQGKDPLRFPFQELRKVLALAAEAPQPDALDPYIDVDRFYRFMACEILAGHGDGYCMGNNNYRFFIPDQDLESPGERAYGRIVFIPHGTDQTWVRSQSAVLPMFVTKVPRLMLSTDAACERFRASFFQTMSKALDVPRLQSRIRMLQAEIQPALQSMDPEAAKRQETAAHELSEGLQKRQDHLLAYFSSEPRLLTPDSPGVQEGTDRKPLFKIPLDAWIAHEQLGDCSLFQTNTAAGKSPMAVVAIQSTSYSSMGSWRARVRLPVGRYLLKGEASILYSSQFANAARPTVLFQDYTGPRDLKSFPQKLNTWVELSSKVDVSEPGQVVELVIGLNGLKSGLLFDLGSLALESCQTP